MGASLLAVAKSIYLRVISCTVVLHLPIRPQYQFQSFIYRPTFNSTWPILSYFAVMPDLILIQLSTPTAVVVIFYSRVFYVPLNLNIFSQKIIFATYACTREHSVSLLILTTKNTLISSHDTFIRDCSTNL